MKLTGLTLYHFRNYEELHLALHPGVNLLVGENAQGKTNLLEAVFYLSTGGSFRTGRAQELIGFGAEFADLSCELFSGGREQSIRAVLFANRRPRQLYIGGVKQRSAAELPADDAAVLPGRSSDPEGRSGGQAEAARYGTLPAAARLRRGACRVSEALRQQEPHSEGLSRAAVAA